MYVVEKATLSDVLNWAENAFIITDPVSELHKLINKQHSLTLRFIDVRTSKPVIIAAHIGGAGL